MAIKQPSEMSQEAVDEIGKLISQLKGERAVEWLLREVFDTEEIKQAEKYIAANSSRREVNGKKGNESSEDYSLPPHAIDIYAAVRLVDPVVAAVDMSALMSLLTPPRYAWLRRELGIENNTCDITIRQAMEEAALVVDEYRRWAIWNTRQIEIDFDTEEKPWWYLWRLCCAATRGRSLSPEDFSAATTAKHLTQWKHNLTKSDAFPVDLGDLIQASNGRHRLLLESKDIKVFPNSGRGPLP